MKPRTEAFAPCSIASSQACHAEPATALRSWVILQSATARWRGLLLRAEPPPGEGWLLPQCAAIHTWGMGFDIDVVFLGAGGCITGVRQGVPPNRVCWRRGASAVVELRAGQVAVLGWRSGQQVQIAGALCYR